MTHQRSDSIPYKINEQRVDFVDNEMYQKFQSSPKNIEPQEVHLNLKNLQADMSPMSANSVDFESPDKSENSISSSEIDSLKRKNRYLNSLANPFLALIFSIFPKPSETGGLTQSLCNKGLRKLQVLK